jgi:hypothetical protein
MRTLNTSAERKQTDPRTVTRRVILGLIVVLVAVGALAVMHPFGHSCLQQTTSTLGRPPWVLVDASGANIPLTQYPQYEQPVQSVRC